MAGVGMSLVACYPSRQSVDAAAPAVSTVPTSPAPPVAPATPVEPGKPVTDNIETITGAVVEDAAHRSGLPRESIKVLAATRVTWPDGSLGCPEPGMLYTQALVPGYRIVVQAGERQYEYHAGTRGQPTYCPPERIRPPVPDSDAM